MNINSYKDIVNYQIGYSVIMYIVRFKYIFYYKNNLNNKTLWKIMEIILWTCMKR